MTNFGEKRKKLKFLTFKKKKKLGHIHKIVSVCVSAVIDWGDITIVVLVLCGGLARLVNFFYCCQVSA